MDPENGFELGSNEVLRLIAESATDFAIFFMDPDGLVTSWNPVRRTDVRLY